MDLATRPFDPAVYLTDDAAVAEYIGAALETGDAEFIGDAFNVVMRARGMAELAGATGLSRSALYRAFSKDGNPTLATLLSVLHALGLKLTAEPQGQPG